MEVSIFLAQLIGSYLLVIAAIMLIHKNRFQSSVNAVMSNEGLISVTGIISLILGLAIAISHSVWQLNWHGVLTLFGYLLIISGIARILYPLEMKEKSSALIKNYYWYLFGFAVVLGLFLSYHGFMG